MSDKQQRDAVVVTQTQAERAGPGAALGDNPRRWHGYDWAKLGVAGVLGSLLLPWGLLTGTPQASAPTAAPAVVATAPTASVAMAAPSLQAPAGALAAGPITLQGRGTPNSTVEVVVDGTPVGTATVGADGGWSLPTTLAEGAREVVVRAVDAGGQVVASAAPTTLNVGAGVAAGATGGAAAGATSTAGAAATGLAPTLDVPSDSIGAGAITLQGRGTPNSTVEVVIDGTPMGTATVGADGGWSLATTLAEGAREVVVQAVDAGGQVVASAEPTTLNINAAPVAGATEEAAATGLAPTLDVPSGSIAAGPITLQGRGTPNSTVEVVVDGTPVGTATVGADGSWSLATTLAEGAREVVVQAVDAGGQVVASAEPTTFNVAATVPTAPGTLAIASPVEGATLPSGSFTITGTGTPGSQVEVLDSDKIIDTVTVGPDGVWSTTYAPPDGTVALGVRPAGQQDLATTPLRATIGAAQAYCTELAVGCQAWVTRERDLSLRIRAGAGTDQAIIDQLPIGTQMELLEGPQPATEYNWWRVRTVGGLEGWVAGEELRLQPD